MYHKKEFAKAQVAAFLGTAADYLIFILLTSLTGIWYVYANVIGAATGAVTNFLLGRFWAFDAKSDSITHQAGRYVLVSAGSLLLNTLGLYLLTEFTPLASLPAKILVGIFVAVTYNYLLQKYFVFKK